MAALGVREAEIEETFVRSGGARAARNVNKSSSCVMVLHRPTGLRVKCQTTRQQGVESFFLARRLLLDKIERMRKGYLEAERSQIEKNPPPETETVPARAKDRVLRRQGASR